MRPKTASGMCLKTQENSGSVKQFRESYQEAQMALRTSVQNALRATWPADRPSHRTLSCGRRFVGDTAAGWRNQDGRTHISGLVTCGMVWTCPTCAPRIQRQRRDELKHALRTWQQQSAQHRVLLVTFTTPHRRDMAAVETIRQLNRALERFKQSRQYRRYRAEYLHGTVRALEITWGEANGWHPHHHQLDFVRSEVPEAMKQELRAAWIAALRKEGLGRESADDDLERYALDFRSGDAAAEYVTTAWELASMTTKEGAAGHYNAFQLLQLEAMPLERRRALFVQYALATHGRQQLTWSPGLKAYFRIQELDDQLAAERQEAAEASEAVKVCDFTPPQWRVVIQHDAEAQIHQLLRTLPLETAQRDIDSFIYKLSRQSPRNSDPLKYRVWRGTPSHQIATGELQPAA